MPSKLLDALLVVLVNVLLALVLVVVEHDALQESVRIGKLAYLVLHVLAHVLDELEVGVHLKLLLQALRYLGAEVGFVLHGILAEHLVEQLLTHLGLDVARYFGNLIAEVSRQAGHLFLLHLEQRSHFNVAIGVSLLRVEGDDVAQLAALKELLLVVRLDVVGHKHRALDGNATLLGVALLVKLAQVALQHVVCLVFLHLVIVAGARREHVNLAVDYVVVNGDSVVVYGVLVGQRGVHLGSNGYVKLERVGSVLLQVDRLLRLVGQRLAEHLDVVVLHIFIYFLAEELVDFVHLHGRAILLLNHPHRHHAHAEARHVGLLAVVLQCLLDIVLIVSLFYGQGDKSVHLVRIFKCNFHLSFFMLFLMIIKCELQNY